MVWNRTFKAFADYWSFEPRLCQPYRAQTKGKVESGVKYVKGNFLPGRSFVDQLDFDEQLAEWNATVADTRAPDPGAPRLAHDNLRGPEYYH